MLVVGWLFVGCNCSVRIIVIQRGQTAARLKTYHVFDT